VNERPREARRPPFGDDVELVDIARSVGERLLAAGRVLVTAESCTGGRIAAAVTDVPGSSDWFDRGFVSYSNRAKTDMLGVPTAVIASEGSVSRRVAELMAEGALIHSAGTVSVAVTGVAGPGGGSEAKPVGTVCFAWAGTGRPTRSEQCHFEGDRVAVRERSVRRALAGILELTAGR
jgi:nicotinamide-nucleotide amidase